MKLRRLLMILFASLVIISMQPPLLHGYAQPPTSIIAEADSVTMSASPDDPQDTWGLIVSYSGDGVMLPRVSTAESYVRFNLTGLTTVGPGTELTLNIGAATQLGMTIGLYEIADDNWDEKTITWNNAPTRGSLITTVYTQGDTPSEVTFTGQALADYINANISGNKKASFVLVFNSCVSCSSASDSVGFWDKDSVIIEPTPLQGPTLYPLDPTSATLASFDGSPYWNGVELNWQTASELSLAGFNLYRSETLNGVRVPVMTGIGPQLPGTMEGASYQWFDLGLVPFKTYYYWLEVLSIDGSSDIVDPVSITAHQMIFLPLISH